MRSLVAIVEASGLVNGGNVYHTGLFTLFGAALWVFFWGGEHRRERGNHNLGQPAGMPGITVGITQHDHHQSERHIPRGVRGGCERVTGRSSSTGPRRGPWSV